jgi:hypothetical protein
MGELLKEFDGSLNNLENMAALRFGPRTLQRQRASLNIKAGKPSASPTSPLPSSKQLSSPDKAATVAALAATGTKGEG